MNLRCLTIFSVYAICSLLLAGRLIAAVEWHVIKVNGRDFLDVDNIAKFCKMTLFERAGDRVLILLSSGNLAGTQAIISLLAPRDSCLRNSRRFNRIELQLMLLASAELPS